jgi:hypothetical protein
MQFGKKPAEVCRRRSQRQDVMLAGSALAPARSRSIVISDLSRAGARLGGRDLPPAGDDILVVVGSSDMLARVIWRTGDGCGVLFEPPLEDDNVARMKREGDWESATGWWR